MSNFCFCEIALCTDLFMSKRAHNINEHWILCLGITIISEVKTAFPHAIKLLFLSLGDQIK